MKLANAHLRNAHAFRYVKADLRFRSFAHGEVAALAAAFATASAGREHRSLVDSEILEMERAARATFVTKAAAANTDALHAQTAKRYQLLQVNRR